MIEAVSPPVEIVSNFTRVNPISNQLEIHRYESVNGGSPRHVIEYKIYTSRGELAQSHQPSIDIKA